jgi:bifunctional enzyme CysN/CysC
VPELAAPHRELLRLATAGSVDDGKSTLIGRLLLDTGSLFTDHLDDVSRDGTGPDLAAVTDGLRAEREQGITIDVAYRFFSTERRSFILADTPGHERYTRNMFTGASTSDLAVVLIDARLGVVRQTRRHVNIASLLGMRHIVFCVNKMDLVGWDAERFAVVEQQARELARRLEIPDAPVIPVSALSGDNVATASEQTPFYTGPTLLDHLETVDVQADRDLAHLRLPVQWVGRGDSAGGRLYTGRIVGGTLQAGDDVVILPSGATATIASVDTLDPDTEIAVPPMAVAFGLAEELDLGRGDMLVSAERRPPTARELDATLCWMTEEPLRPGRRYALKHTTRTVRATLARELEPAMLSVNDIGGVTLRTSSPVLADSYAENSVTGAFILIDEHSNETVAAGIIQRARVVEPPKQERRDVKWHKSSIDRRERWNALGQRGATVLLTGLSASGKSTIAVALERALVDEGQSAYLLDGDNIRQGLSDDLGFSAGDRSEHIRRVGQVARLFADSGTVAVASLISPLAADRDLMRAAHAEAGLPFIEVFVDTPIEECERRDPKGMYARARAGELKGFTGVDTPYEPPTDPEVRIVTLETSVEEAVESIRHHLRSEQPPDTATVEA